MMSEETHDIAQVCLNGHMITTTARTMPEFASNFCSTCGEATTAECAHCHRPIRGSYLGTLPLRESKTPPAFCLNCGRPYPWTEASIKAAQELASELVGLSQEERVALAKTLP